MPQSIEIQSQFIHQAQVDHHIVRELDRMVPTPAPAAAAPVERDPAPVPQMVPDQGEPDLIAEEEARHESPPMTVTEKRAKFAAMQAESRARKEAVEAERRRLMEHTLQTARKDVRKKKRAARNKRYYDGTRKPREDAAAAAAAALAAGRTHRRADLSGMTDAEEKDHKNAQTAVRMTRMRLRRKLKALMAPEAWARVENRVSRMDVHELQNLIAAQQAGADAATLPSDLDDEEADVQALLAVMREIQAEQAA